MTQIKSARKTIKTDVTISIVGITFDSTEMKNTIEWDLSNPQAESILSFDFIIFENDTSTSAGAIKKTIELNPASRSFIHRNISIISNKNTFKTYSYQVIAYTGITSTASQIEKFDPREIYEIKGPKQVTHTINNNEIHFDISCEKNKFASNIFIFKKHFDDDVFERIGVIPYAEQTHFIDNIEVSLGHFYEYRFMTLDLFQHFAQNIVKIDIFVWTKNYSSSRTNILNDPIPLAEYSAESSNKKYIKLKISNVDPKCLIYRIKRRDITEKSRDFSEVEQWDGQNLIRNENNKELIFVDNIVRNDCYYQYCVYGIDKFSNETDVRQSNIVFTQLNGDLPASPVTVAGNIIKEYPTGVRLEWTDDNLNQKLGDIISGSSDLFPKQNLFYFKVFRRQHNELNYQSFPEQSSSFFIDMCSNDGVVIETKYPYFQPTPPIRDSKYYYYVATYDAETNIRSNRSHEVFVDLSVIPSEVINLKSYYNNVFNPPKCILKWDTQENEKTLDSFSVDRIEEGKIWRSLGKSYFNTQFIDTTIEKNKKYMYRVAPIDFNGNKGKYVFIIIST